MPKLAENRINKKFNKLLIINQKLLQTKLGYRTRYLCKCDCGIEKWSSWNTVKNSKSCGCSRMENNLAKKHKATNSMSAEKFIYRTYQKNAKRRNISFNLSFEEMVKLIDKPCTYCGTEKSNTVLRHGFPFKYNGLDRFYSDKGYDKKNVLPCCKYCNMAKGNRNPKEFDEWILNLYWKSFEGD